MSHDLYLKHVHNYCSSCGREDVDQLEEYNVSYNHCWIWYDKFDKEHGFRAMYKVALHELIPKLEQLKADLIIINGGLPTHKMITDREHKDQFGINDYGKEAWSNEMIETIDAGVKDPKGNTLMKDDGWARTNYNAYRCINEILKKSYRHVDEAPNAIWYGD